MTISTTANRADFSGNNCTKVFPFTFKILATTDLDVFVDNCQKTITTDYTVSGAGAATGGNVTFVTAPGCGLAVAVVRDVPYTQATAYPESGPFPASAHEDALDKVTMLAQQIKELATRSWRFAAGSVRAAAGYAVPEPVASKYVRINSDCTNIEYVALTACGTYADPVTTKGDLIVGGNTGGQERLGITAGFTLVADSATSTGRPRWMPGLSVELTNKLDTALTAGDVVAVGKDCDRSVVAADVQGCLTVFVVAPATIGDDCLAVFHVSGAIRNVKAQGAIPRGNYVWKSAASLAVEDAGVSMGVAQPPTGAVGVATTAAAGGLVDLIFWGQPLAGTELPPLMLSPGAATLGAGVSLVTNLGTQGQDQTLDFEDVGDTCAIWVQFLSDCLRFTCATFHLQHRMAHDCTNKVGWIVQTRPVIAAGDTWDGSYTNCDVLDPVTVQSTPDKVSFFSRPLTMTGWTCNRLLQVKVRRVPQGSIGANADGKAKIMMAYITLK